MGSISVSHNVTKHTPNKVIDMKPVWDMITIHHLQVPMFNFRGSKFEFQFSIFRHKKKQLRHRTPVPMVPPTTASEVSIGRGPSEFHRQVKAADITRNRFQVEQQLWPIQAA